MQLNKTFKIIAFSTFGVLLFSCSVIHKPVANGNDGTNDPNETTKAVVFDNPENYNQTTIVDNSPLFENQVADTALSYDTVSYVESVGFQDTLLTFSNVRLNSDQTANEIISESKTIRFLDSLVNITFFTDDFITDRDLLNKYGYLPDEIPVFNDSVYIARINTLNRYTPFDLTYNKTIKNFIDLYTVKKRDLTERLLGLSEIYFPLFEQALDQYNLPLELKYLAVVESALIPTAGSHAGAKGLWQFMYRTGKHYGLEVTTMVDDRFDPHKSTDAAARHLIDLYNIYGDWSLVLAAYNSGAGNVNKAIRRAGGIKSYWAIWPFLPRETRGYVPAFIAVYYLMNHAAEHNLYPVDPGILYNGIDTVHVNDVLAFDQISEFLNIPYNDVKFLNPSFKLGIIPATPENPYVLRLPKERTGDFISNEKEIYAFKTKKGIERDKLLAQIEAAQHRDVHIVRSGETLGAIARRYHTSVANIQAWNSLRNTIIYPGQRLTVYANPGAAKSSATIAHTVVSQSNGTAKFHTVKRGENLGLIATRYGCSVNDIMKWNNLRNNTIHPNQKLFVSDPAKSATAALQGDDVRYITYKVKNGDTLWDIAKKYDGVTVNQIKELNNLGNANRLKPGQTLRIAIRG
jgi:membrane-bound lytic murein transglycosylase D